MSNVLIYLSSHSFLYKFRDLADVGHWSIILESASIKTSFFNKGMTCAVLNQDGKLPSCRE